MAADVQIRFRAEGKQARSEIDQLKKEFADLRQQMGQTQRTATQTAASVDKVGDEAQAAAIGVTSLGRNIFKTSAEAKRFNGVFLDTHGIIREANGEFAKTKETIDRLGDEARETTREVKGLGTALDTSGRGVTGFAGATQGASRGTQIFTRALGSAAGILAELGIHSAVRAIADFATGSVRAAGELEQYLRATEQITGSTFAAEERIESLIEIANLPGLNFEALTRFSNRLIAAGVSAEDTDKILLTTGQTVVSLGGSAEKAALAMEQIIQAIQLGTVDMRDFRTIVQQIPGFLEVLGDVHGVAANLDGLHDAFDKVGRNMRDLLIPTFDALAKRYESPPPDSYIVSIDRLKNSFFLFQAELGEKVLPAVSATARGLADLFDGMRSLLEGTPSVTETLREFNSELREADGVLASSDAIQTRIRFLETLIERLEETRRNLGIFDTRGRAGVTSEISRAESELAELQGVQSGSPERIAELTAQLSHLNEALATVQGKQTDLENTATRYSENQQKRFERRRQNLETEELGIIAQIEQTEKLLDTANAAFKGTLAALRQDEIAKGENAAVTAELAEKIVTTVQATKALTDSVLTADTAMEVFTPTLEQSLLALSGDAGLTGLMRAAARETVQFAETLQAVDISSFRVSLADAAKEQQELTQYSRELIHELEVLDRLGRPFEVLHEDINLVNPAISDAAENMRLYIREMDDLQDAYETSAQRSDRLTQSIRDQASAFDALRASVGGVSATASGLQGQQLSSDIFDQFDARTPGSSGRGEAVTAALRAQALRQGEILASQAIRTAGELKRIEQDRVESLEDLEREYSEKIIAINEEKARKLGEIEQKIETERLERIAAIQTAFETAAAAEVAAREQVAEQILQIEARANAERQRLRERLTDQLVDLETQRDERIQDLQDGLTEREQERQQQILDITEKAAADRAAAEAQYAETVRSINDKLVEDVLAVQQELAENIERLQSGLADREQARQTRILEITEQAAADRAAAERTYTDTLQGIYNDVVQQWDALEDGFTQRTAERAEARIAIEQDAAQARIDAYKDYEDSVSDIATELVDTVRDIQDKITEVVEDAAAERLQIQEEALTERRDLEQQYQDDIAQIESQRDADIQAQQERIVQIQRDADAARLAADQDYADRYQDIQNSLVDTVRDIQADITEVSAEAAAERLQIESDANAEARADFEAYQDEIAGIEAARITDVAQQEARLADRIQDIQNNLVDRVVDIQRDLTDTLADLRQQELDTEQDRLDSLVELHADSQNRIEDIERKGAQTQADIRREYHRDVQDAQLQLERALADADSDEDREQAQERFNRRVQDIGIENRRDYEDLAVRQEREREAVLRRQAEQEIAIAESAAARLAEIESQKAAAQAAARTGIAEAESQAGVTFGEAQANYVAALSETEQALADVNAKIVEITDAAFHETAEAALALKDSLSELATETQHALSARKAETETQVADLQGQITGAESRAGVTFGEAQENYVAALSESEQAAADHAEALKTIAENTESDIGEVNAKIVEITDAAFTETAEAALALKDSLSALDVETQNALSALTQRTGETVGGLQGQITDAEATAGVSFQAALTRYTPAVDLNTQALNTLNATLADITATETTGLTQLAAAGVADRAETTAAQQVLLAEAGVSLDAARAGYVPALSAAAQATLTLNETIRDLDTGLQEALTAINVEGQLDRQTTAENIQTAIANALAQQLELEGQAGLTFAEASLAFQPGVSDLTQAGIDRDTVLSGIDTTEQEGIAEVNAQSIADRLATDAEITAARDAYIQARDQAILEHNTAIRELGVKEAADIATIKETLKVDLAGIQTTLTAELDEIRDQKVLFDAKMNELINAINETANLDFAQLKTDTEAMRTELEAIAEEARNNAWKQGILKIANVGITVAGVAVGAAVGGPAGAALGGQIGGAIGGLVEQGGNELFHFEQTDAIARRLARQAAFREPRAVTQNFFPTVDQIRNAHDVGREVVSGALEAFAQRERTQVTAPTGDFDGTQEIRATLSIEWPDGATIELRDQILRVEQQDR